MKMDKIKFAEVVAYIGTLRPEYDIDLYRLDAMLDIEAPQAPILVDPDRIERLMALMQQGTQIIEAIKEHRRLTGFGLKESKDAVERYWPQKLSADQVAEKINRAFSSAGITNEGLAELVANDIVGMQK